ncbi:MAG: 2-C-methyl-D-erythritol 4-phosphate cytidylyltransferase [Lachnospiraceae bacterium]|nr:2-C-methyl-D-erythritol 4-phosphate cytidylyltransferase [Lachnospiraceae bacterium]
MIFAGILAGGIGSRMNIADMPKQFLPLMGKPIIIHTIEKFLICDKIDYVYVGVHKEWITHMNDIVEKYLSPFKDKVILTKGGQDRNDTIINIISEIESRHSICDEDIILTHDGVRPFITRRIIEENIIAAKEHGACDTVIPATDTIVISEDGGIISHVPERKQMYQGQTPQSFKISLLKKTYNEITQDEKSILTDACKALVIKAVPVAIVLGDVSNIKITTMTDLKIAEYLVSSEGLKLD